jgi:hypothetical protein
MTVADLIKELQDLCEGRDPATVEVKKVEYATGDMWGDNYTDFFLDSCGGNAYPFTILIK